MTWEEPFDEPLRGCVRYSAYADDGRRATVLIDYQFKTEMRFNHEAEEMTQFVFGIAYSAGVALLPMLVTAYYLMIYTGWVVCAIALIIEIAVFAIIANHFAKKSGEKNAYPITVRDIEMEHEMAIEAIESFISSERLLTKSGAQQ